MRSIADDDVRGRVNEFVIPGPINVQGQPLRGCRQAVLDVGGINRLHRRPDVHGLAVPGIRPLGQSGEIRLQDDGQIVGACAPGPQQMRLPAISEFVARAWGPGE